MFELTPTLPNVTYGKLFMSNGVQYWQDMIVLWRPDEWFEQCSNRHQLYMDIQFDKHFQNYCRKMLYCSALNRCEIIWFTIKYKYNFGVYKLVFVALMSNSPYMWCDFFSHCSYLCFSVWDPPHHTTTPPPPPPLTLTHTYRTISSPPHRPGKDPPQSGHPVYINITIK